MSVNIRQEWMTGVWDGEKHYNPAEWMKGEWNIFFFYELMKLGENACMKFCMDNGLITKSYVCPLCGDQMKLVARNKQACGKVWSCRKAGKNGNPHRVLRAVRRGSWFQDSHISLGQVLCLVYMWINKMPNESIMNNLGHASQTITDWLNFCREVCMDECLAFDGQIGGDEKIVEIIDCVFGERKYNKGRNMEGYWVFGGLVRHSTQCFFEVVNDRNADVLLEVIKKRILPGTTLISDCWSSYNCHSHEGYQELAATQSLTYVDLDKTPITTVDGTWKGLEKSLHNTRHVHGEFDAYIAENVWRRQNNFRITEKVQRFFRAVSRAFPPSGKDD